MKNILKSTLVVLFFVASYSLNAGCNYFLGNFIVIGNYTYDTLNTTYYFYEGDTISIFYTGTGTGSIYTEEYYYNDTDLIGNFLDTIKVARQGTYKVNVGCGGADHTFSVKLLAVTPNSLSGQSQFQFDLITNFNPVTGSIDCIIETNTSDIFEVELLDISGKQIFILTNFLPYTKYSIPIKTKGLYIVKVSNGKKESIVRKVIVP